MMDHITSIYELSIIGDPYIYVSIFLFSFFTAKALRYLLVRKESKQRSKQGHMQRIIEETMTPVAPHPIWQ
ncbi:hypothetical protein VNO77_41259 [Canavalia gladiata]|uniref:Uncharacterized protein n=1 Tax=Canavalia gladiata TaxID=3824 RepID=A0AAN9JZ78_CANGL